MKSQKPHKYLTPFLIFLLLFSISLSYTYITPSLIKVAKIISSENSQYFLDFTNDPALKVFGSIITEKDVNTTSGRFCIGSDCISSWNSLSGIPSGYCVLFYNATCPSGFDLKENLTQPYLSGWNYRKPITITDTSGTTLTDYQVKITLDTQSLISQNQMRNDCGDIRFTDSSGSIIPYWIEDGTCNTPNTNIWVKVPEIPANGQTTIYMFYGRPTADSESNGEQVFEFFDDFNNGIVDDKWGTISGTPVEEDGTIILQDNDVREYVSSTDSFEAPYILESKFKSVGTGYVSGILMAKTPTGDAGGSETVSVYEDYRIEDGDGFAYVVRKPDGSTYSFTEPGDDNYHIIKFKVESNYYSHIYRDDVLKVEGTSDASPTYIMLTSRAGSTELYVDWVFIRKFASFEPTITLGSEQPNEPDYKLICCKE